MVDASGRLILKGNFAGETKIDVRGLINGNYIFNLVLEGSDKFSEKFIIIK